MHPSSATTNTSDGGFIYTKTIPDLGIRKSGIYPYARLSDFFVVELCLPLANTVRVQVMSLSVILVLASSAVLQVRQAVVRFLRVNMVRFHTFGPRPNKSKQYQLINSEMSLLTILVRERQSQIVMTPGFRSQDAASMVRPPRMKTTNTPERGRFVKIKPRHLLPSFGCEFFCGKFLNDHGLKLLKPVFSLWSGSAGANTPFGPFLIIAPNGGQ